jgi:hypothetical protein
MNQVLIGDVATYAAKQGGGTVADATEANLLQDGALAIFLLDGTLVTAATTPASIANYKQFLVAVGTASGVFWSTPIDRDMFYRAYCAYVAPVKQITHIGYNGSSGSFNFPASLVAGDVATLGLGLWQEGREPSINWQNYNYTVKTGDTEVIVIQALIDAINNDPDAPAVAAQELNGPTLEGIELTTKDFGERLYVKIDDIIVSADIEVTTPITYGKGTPAQVAELEAKARILDGDSNRIHYAQFYWDIPSEVNPGAQYDLYSFQWSTERRNAVNVDNVALPSMTLAISDATLQSSVDTILTTVLLVSIPNTGAGSVVSPL